MGLIELQQVKKSFGPTLAIDDLSLSIERGETTVLVGQSGCGKSTVIRMIVGLVYPDAGSVTFDGQAITPESAPDLRRRTGYVIQDGGLFPHLTARDNVTIMARHLKQPPETIGARLSELRELTHFPEDGLDRFPAELSGGQRQRLGLMRALMLDPEVLLLDEPLGALDPMIRAGLQDDLRDIFRRLQKTVVIVTHDIGEAGYFADKLAMIHGGRVLQEGPLREFVRQPADETVTQFIRSQRRPLEGLD